MTTTVTQKSRGPTKAADMARRAAAHDRARICIKTLTKDLEGQDSEFIIEVFRCLVRAIGGALVQRAGEGRATGVLCGVLMAINPAWKSDTTKAREEAEAVFGRAA